MMRSALFSLVACGALAAAGHGARAADAAAAAPEHRALGGAAAGRRLLSVLREKDAERYREIFRLQEKGAWGPADRIIAALDDETLMGHVLYQRYMHPTAYRSKYGELKKWMAYYADHPDASKIYALAMKRRPRGKSAPLRPIPRKWRNPEGYDLHPDLVADYERTSRPRLKRIEGRVRYLVRREQAAVALKEIDRHLKNRVITQRQYDRMRSWIAASYYYQGYVDAAKRIATDVAEKNGETALLAHWIAGLIAFREGELEESHRHFTAQARVPHQEDSLRSAAGFWAARTALAAGAPEDIAPNLEIAAQFPFTFYGQLALAQLGREYAYDWEGPLVTEDGFEKLVEAHPAVKRAAALAQVGKKTEGELELRWVNGAIEDHRDYDLMAVAIGLEMPAAQVDIALAGEAKYLEAGLFPVPDYAPRGGFETDRAVLYALMRQESKFKLDATSRVGARGLMQIMPRTASYVARDRSLYRRSGRDRLYDPGLNLDLGQKYVNQLIDRHTQGDLFKVAIAYNGGPGNLRRWDRKLSIDDPLLFVESIPNPESRDFVEKVLTNVWVYRDRLGQPAPTREKVAAGDLPLYEAIDQLAEEH